MNRFVALTAVVFCGLVLPGCLSLDFFQGQVEKEQDNLQDFQDKEEQKELLERASAHCTQACTQAMRSKDCSLESLANLCITYGSAAIDDPKYLDLNNNKENDVDTSMLSGVGLCEDKVPCHALVAACCDQQINAKSCEGILERYWSQEGFNASEIDNKFKQEWVGGTCDPNSSTYMWWNQIEHDVCRNKTCA